MQPDKTYPERNYEVGRALLGLRTCARLTQAQLAKLVEVSNRSVEKWETGEVYPSEQRVRKLVEVLLEVGAFLVGKELEEAQAFWELASQNAPRRLSLFDESWFRQLLSTRQAKLTTPTVTDSVTPLPRIQPNNYFLTQI